MQIEGAASETLDLAEFDGVQLEGLDFCLKAYALFERIRRCPDGASRLRMRSSAVEKKLLEELLPIAKYVQDKLRPGRYFQIEWHSGNQQFDARVIQSGAYIEQSYYPANSFLEVTCAVHKNDYLMREVLDKDGGAFGLEGLSRVFANGGKAVKSTPVVQSSPQFVHAFAEVVVAAVAAKREKTYPDCTTLVVQCGLNTLYLSHEWELLARSVAEQVDVAPFQEVYLYDPTTYYSHSLYPRR